MIDMDEMMRESPLPMQRRLPSRPPRRGSISGSRLDEGDGTDFGGGSSEKDDKKKRGRSPFRSV